MEDLIKFSYNDDENAKKKIEEGKFRLHREDTDVVILPQVWEMLVEPRWNVVIRLESQPDLDTDSSSDSDDVSNAQQDESEKKQEGSEGTYAVKIKYTIDYYENLRTAIHGQQDL